MISSSICTRRFVNFALPITKDSEMTLECKPNNLLERIRYLYLTHKMTTSKNQTIIEKKSICKDKLSAKKCQKLKKKNKGLGCKKKATQKKCEKTCGMCNGGKCFLICQWVQPLVAKMTTSVQLGLTHD